MEITENQKAIAVMCSLFNGFTTEKALMYDKFLSDIPAPLLSLAIKSLVETLKFPPTVADIRLEAERIYKISTGTVPMDAGQSWERVKKGMSKWGSYQFDKFLAELKKEGDSLTAETITQYGWEAFGRVRPEDMGTARAQYMRLYNNNVSRQKEEKRIAQILQESGETAFIITSLSEKKALPWGD